jgi:hypothetical protein
LHEKTAGQGAMSEQVKGVLIVAIAILIMFALWRHFSPYWTCVRAMVADGTTQRTAEVACNGPH